VDPSGQYLFTGNALLGGTTAVGQYVIGSDGTLAPNAIPAVNVTGWNQLTFTPNGKFTFVPDFQDGVIDSYSLSASGSLAQVNQLSVDSIPANVQPTAIDPSGRFLYFFECTCTNSSSYSLMEYGISADGALTPLSPNYVVAPGYTYSLTVGPNGFLYFPDIDHGTVTVFQIDESAGQLANAGSFATGTGPGSAPLSIAFNPSGTYAYVVNTVDNSVTQFTVNPSTGALSMNGPDVPTGRGPAWVVVDPSGSFVFVTNSLDGTISQFAISSSGRLTPNGTFSLEGQTAPVAMTFAQR
jgi:6-phosphogluconolactonase (cycloisomerase 2 family)